MGDALEVDSLSFLAWVSLGNVQHNQVRERRPNPGLYGTPRLPCPACATPGDEVAHPIRHRSGRRWRTAKKAKKALCLIKAAAGVPSGFSVHNRGTQSHDEFRGFTTTSAPYHAKKQSPLPGIASRADSHQP